MKKLLVLFMVISLVFLTGCPDKNEDKSKDSENKVQVKKIDPKSAKSFMENYMGYVLKRDTGAMKSFYSPELKDKIRDIPMQSNPHPVGFKLGEGESKENKETKESNVEFKVHIYNAYTGTPYYSDDSLKYTVAMNSGKLYIDKIEKDKTTIEVYSKGDVLYKKEGDKVIGDYVVSLKDLPDYGIPRYTSSPEQKFPIPRQAFGPCAISPDGKDIVITSMEKHSFLALVKGGEEKEKSKDKETMNMQPGEKKGGGQGQGGGGEQQGTETQQNPQAAEMERIKKQTIKPIDFFLDTKINVITFSPNGKMFAVEYVPAGKLSNIIVYKGEGGEVLETKLSKQFRADRFSITNPYFSSEDKFVFKVTPVSDATKEEQSQAGTWNYDTKEEKLSKIQ